MLKQFNLNELRFDDPTLTTDEEGQPIATTHGAGWYALTDPAHIEGINASITGGGEVWLEDGQLHYSGAMPSPYHIFDRKAQRWRLPNEAERLTERQAYIERLKVLKRNEINDQAQAFVNAAAKLDQTPDFERATWQEQANESVAWHADNRTPTPTLDTIAQNRGIPVDVLRQKAYEKTMAFRHLTNTIAGQRQHFEDRLELADTPEAIDNIVVSYHINPEAESNE